MLKHESVLETLQRIIVQLTDAMNFWQKTLHPPEPE